MGRIMRIGIWCAYHVTLEPSEGIGVFAHNLALGLSSMQEKVEVVMVARNGQEDVMSPTVSKGNGRIRVFSIESFSKHIASEANGKEEVQSLKLQLDTIRHAHQRASRRSLDRYQSKITRVIERFSGRSRLGNRVSGSLAYFAFGANKVYREFLRVKSRRIERKLGRENSEVVNAPSHQLLEHCDVWLVPYVCLDMKFSKPTVVTIHDLVTYHFPETVSPEALISIKQLVAKVSEQSTIAACLTDFIRRNDLIGQLGLPESKIRVVSPAPPIDFQTPPRFEDAAAEYPILHSKYILYPSAFRAYKNHQALIHAIRILKDRGDRETQIVFTGIQSMPENLRKLVSENRVEDRVHTLGKCPRDVLSLLYQRAVGTVVPSLYEQGSFPLMEALHWQCPIASSRIPSLVEQFSPLGQSMLHFSPHDYEELADTIETLRDSRERVLQSQQYMKSRIFDRTWKDAAEDWVRVFREAIVMYEKSKDITPTTSCKAA